MPARWPASSAPPQEATEMTLRIGASLVVLAASLHANGVLAQASGDTPPPVPAETSEVSPEGVQRKQVYTPQDFARFAPKTAYDILVQVPGFTIHGAGQER